VTVGREGQLRLGTRGSALARAQTALVREALEEAHRGVQIEVVVIRTEGDRVQDRPLSQFGDKGVFVRAIEAALLDGAIDLAVHSLKDIPGDSTVQGLEIAAFSPRADPRDVLVSGTGAGLMELPAGTRIGTSSPRRRMLLGELRPDLIVADIRGNVETRLAKVRNGEYAGTILAAAGLERLGRLGEATEFLPPHRWVPDAGQGIIAVQGRIADPALTLARAIDNPRSRVIAVAEREVVRTLGAGCSSPVGAYAEVDSNAITLWAVASSSRGGQAERATATGPLEAAAALGKNVGERLLAGIGAYTGP